jgi:hypothetical protein
MACAEKKVRAYNAAGSEIPKPETFMLYTVM